MPDAQELIKKVQEKVLRFEASQLSLSEDETKLILIDPIFAAIGWDMECLTVVRRPWKKNPADNPVDYAFMINGVPKLLVEAERLRKSITDRKWRDQLLLYSSQSGVRWCVLTNGNTIRVYNSLAEEPAADKLLFEIEVRTIDTPDGLPINVFVEKLSLLSEQNLREGKINEIWDSIYSVRKVFDCLKAKKEDLTDYIVKNTKLTKKSVSGVLDQIIGLRQSFLAKREETHISRDELPLSETVAERPSSEQKEQGVASVAQPDYVPLFDSGGKPISYKRKKPSSLWFRESEYELGLDTSWKLLLVKLCSIINIEHKNEFDKVLEIKGNRGRKTGEDRFYFAKDRSKLDSGVKIPNTDIFVEGKHPHYVIRKLLWEFGYDTQNIKVKIR